MERYTLKKIAGVFRTLLLLVLLFCSGCHIATAAEPAIAYAELAAGASIIVVGTVEGTELLRPEDPYGNTRASVRVVERLKGTTADTIDICYPGDTSTVRERSLARAEGVTPYHLVKSQQYLFLLAGGLPYRLSHPGAGILPSQALPAFRTALQNLALAVTVATEQTAVRPGDTLAVTVTLRNISAAPVSIRLPRAWGESCRFWSWRAGAEREGNLLIGSPPATDPSGYIPVTLAPGAARVCVHRLQVAPRGRIAGATAIHLAVGVYYLPPDAQRAQCLAAPPVAVMLKPPGHG